MAMGQIIDLGWGHTPELYEVFRKTAANNISVQVSNSNYLPYPGNPNLVEAFKEFCGNVLNLNLEQYHILVVEGASRAITLTKLLLSHTEPVKTRSHYYSKLPKLLNLPLSFDISNKATFLEVPSNPLGHYDIVPSIIMDLAYCSPTYFPDNNVYFNVVNQINKLSPEMLIFSFGKLTGYNNLRLGFIAIKSPVGFYYLTEVMAHSSLGASGLAQEYALQVLSKDKYDKWHDFFAEGRRVIDTARQMLIPVENAYKINGLDNGIGMFRVWEISPEFHKKLSDSGIVTTDVSGMMSNIGQNKAIRINLLKTKEELSEFVRRVNNL